MKFKGFLIFTILLSIFININSFAFANSLVYQYDKATFIESHDYHEVNASKVQNAIRARLALMALEGNHTFTMYESIADELNLNDLNLGKVYNNSNIYENELVKGLSEEEKINLLVEKHNIVSIPVEEIPYGVQPIVIDSYEELKEFIQTIENSELEIEFGVRDADGLEFTNAYNINDLYADINDTNLVRRTAFIRARVTGGVGTQRPWLELWVDYELFSSGSFFAINRILGHGWDLYGGTMAVSLGQNRSNARLTNGNIAADGTASVNYYLLVSGGWHLFTARYEAGFQYTVPSRYWGDYFRTAR